ncbi:MAG: hypothetical protein WBC22_15680 [Sedimentisphaerales bacterium]
MTIVPVLLALPVAGMGFDSCITFGVNEMMAEVEKKDRFCRTQQGVVVREYKYLPVLGYWSVKMCLKGDENIAEAGLHNAPQYSNKDDRNG